jgi:DNA-binding PadR family transcriptional regulator
VSFVLTLGAQERTICRRATCRKRDCGTMEALPLSEPVLLILLSLVERPRHGYAILKTVEEISHGRVTLSTGTLYGALRRLLGDGCIERFKEADRSRGRQAYRLTSRGRQIIRVEVSRLKYLTKVASLRMAPKDL